MQLLPNSPDIPPYRREEERGKRMIQGEGNEGRVEEGEAKNCEPGKEGGEE